jgi:hypothetical protein
MNVISARSGRSGPIRICIKTEGFIAKHPARCGSLIQGHVARSGEATDASIAEEPRMGLDLHISD